MDSLLIASGAFLLGLIYLYHQFDKRLEKESQKVQVASDYAAFLSHKLDVCLTKYPDLIEEIGAKVIEENT